MPPVLLSESAPATADPSPLPRVGISEPRAGADAYLPLYTPRPFRRHRASPLLGNAKRSTPTAYLHRPSALMLGLNLSQVNALPFCLSSLVRNVPLFTSLEVSPFFVFAVCH